MKKTLFSLATASALATALSASITLYQDTQTGAIYTKPGPNRIKLGNFVSEEELKKQNDKVIEQAVKKSLGVKVKSGVPTLKFSGTHYLGYTYTDDHTGADKDTGKFETRRNYFQVKAYWNDTDYMRTTLDTFQDSDGSWLVRLKYAYIYLNLKEYIPATGVEFGQVHRPWIDWEEHHGWLYRSVAKTFIEEGEGAHLTDSADLGINFKTKMDYFSSELGVFNGAGYHHPHTDTDMSYEWRLTANLLGTGKKHVHATEDEYFDVSFTGQINNQKRYDWYALHAVYNQPMFLVAGMFVNYKNYDDDDTHNGWTINGEFRPAEKWSIFARYDDFEYSEKDLTRNQIIAGAAYTYNKNVKFIVNVFDIDDTDNDAPKKVDRTKYMLTTEVHW
ncbi:hypothetical protein [Hydrogenimonas urashimensis]|uniref:hypothetical protein n=1 Tax=Hydrogenimonas urashimensis TaxID=2740515 RepID=UPI0019163E73|nr:hypothetical protein [Hydrogenimonas urashimensis]